jgi:hypothetical protein
MNKLTRAQKAAITKCTTEILEAQEQDPARHRLCEVCKHPACFLIQEAFLQWTSPEVIMKKYGLKSRATIYNHAHAFQLFARRDRTLRFALGHIIEQADRVNVTARDVIQALYTYARVNDDGMWVQPACKSEIVVSKNEAGSSPLESLSGSASPVARSASKPTSHRPPSVTFRPRRTSVNCGKSPMHTCSQRMFRAAAPTRSSPPALSWKPPNSRPVSCITFPDPTEIPRLRKPQF